MKMVRAPMMIATSVLSTASSFPCSLLVVQYCRVGSAIGRVGALRGMWATLRGPRSPPLVDPGGRPEALGQGGVQALAVEAHDALLPVQDEGGEATPPGTQR